MSVKIRMSRHGRRHRPFFRINVIDSRTPRDGRIIEKLGITTPSKKQPKRKLSWILNESSTGSIKARYLRTAVSEILLRKGIKHKYAAERKTRRALARKRARAAGLPFLKSERKTEEKPADGQQRQQPAAEEPKETAQGREEGTAGSEGVNKDYFDNRNTPGHKTGGLSHGDGDDANRRFDTVSGDV